jgi:hypothetical protein
MTEHGGRAEGAETQPGKARSELLMNDPIVTGAKAGVVASVLTLVVEWLLGMTGVLRLITYDYASILILPSAAARSAYERGGTILLAVLTASIFFGVLQVWLYQCTGNAFWVLKGAVYGGLLFITHVSLIPKLWEPRLLPVLNYPGVFAWEAVSKVGWGILSGYVIERLSTEQRMPTAPS